MHSFEVLEPAIDPNNRVSFLLDWELTMKCNLDCSYCKKGLYGGHDNSTSHPPLSGCLESIDFMYRYADLYMRRKPKGIRYVILNVYGGESLHHPDIVTILQQARRAYDAKYQHSWHLTITTTTNAILTKQKLSGVIPLIDEFSVSYHTEASDKEKTLFKSNVLDIRASGKRLKCIVLMHNDPERFADAQNMINWCEQNHIPYLPRQLDRDPNREDHAYHSGQLGWFDQVYNNKTFKIKNLVEHVKNDVDQKLNLSKIGRACCGGKTLCKDVDYKAREFFVHNQFTDWFCSVNEFFLYIKQVNGEIYTNKDCKMNFLGGTGPIGNLNDYHGVLDQLEKNLEQGTLPTIQCKKNRCLCGLCAPKAKLKHTFDKIMEKYHT